MGAPTACRPKRVAKDRGALRRGRVLQPGGGAPRPSFGGSADGGDAEVPHRHVQLPRQKRGSEEAHVDAKGQGAVSGGRARQRRGSNAVPRVRQEGPRRALQVRHVREARPRRVLGRPHRRGGTQDRGRRSGVRSRTRRSQALLHVPRGIQQQTQTTGHTRREWRRTGIHRGG